MLSNITLPRISKAARLTALATLIAAKAPAAVIPITNFDFETNGLSDNNNSVNFTSTIVPTGWTGVNLTPQPAYFGYFNPTDAAYPGTTGNPGVTGTMSGPNVFYFGSAGEGQGIQQATSASFAINTNYTLTVAVGARSGGFMTSLRMQIVAGSTVIATRDVLNPNLGTFADYSVTYTANAAQTSLAGQSVTVRLLETETGGTEVDIDNVRLSSQVVPEASASLLATAGLIACCLRRRR